jgi:hypothetical protein
LFIKAIDSLPLLVERWWKSKIWGSHGGEYEDGFIALMMEAARTSETLVNFYQTTQCYNPEDSHLHGGRYFFQLAYILKQLRLDQKDLSFWARYIVRSMERVNFSSVMFLRIVLTVLITPEGFLMLLTRSVSECSSTPGQ